jgi:hypothetical protein
MVSKLRISSIDEKTKTNKLSFLAARSTLKATEARPTSVVILHSTTKLDAIATANDDGLATITNDDARRHDRSDQDKRRSFYRRRILSPSKFEDYLLTKVRIWSL